MAMHVALLPLALERFRDTDERRCAAPDRKRATRPTIAPLLAWLKPCPASGPGKDPNDQCEYRISREWLTVVAVVDKPGLYTPSYRVQALLNLRQSGAVTIEKFAARLKGFSTEELRDIVKCITNTLQWSES